MKVFLTNRCNLDCIYCFKDKRKKEPELNEIIRKISKARKKIILKGGEPLVRKDILDILKYAKSRKLKIGLETNGILLNNKILKYADELYFVFDTINFEDWKRITKKDRKSYNKSIKGILLAKKANKKVYIDSLLTKLNFKSLEKTKEFCDKNGFILRVLENKSVSGFDYNDSIALGIEYAKKILGKDKNIIYICAPKKRLSNKEKPKYYRKGGRQK